MPRIRGDIAPASLKRAYRFLLLPSSACIRGDIAPASLKHQRAAVDTRGDVGASGAISPRPH